MTITDLTRLPDGSAFFILELPLPEDHWLFQEAGNPPAPMITGNLDPKREVLKRQIAEAGKYALKASIASPDEVGFDPDAFLQNLVIGMLGYNTPDGLSHL